MFNKNIWVFEKFFIHVPYSLIQDKNILTIIGITGLIFGISVILSMSFWLTWACYVA
jgi:uncharacterized membrane protein YjfL (UPF0719 family)